MAGNFTHLQVLVHTGKAYAPAHLPLPEPCTVPSTQKAQGAPG
jgi:hypothetical protein